MTYDEFEVWLDEHRDEALSHLEGIEQASLTRWAKLFGRAIAAEASAYEDDEEPEPDDDEEPEFDPEEV